MRLSCHEIQVVLNSRAQVVKIKTDLENLIRSLLKNQGLVIGKARGNPFLRWAEELLSEDGLLWEVVRPLLDIREKTGREIATLHRKLLDLARNDENSRRSMTVPGISLRSELTNFGVTKMSAADFVEIGAKSSRLCHWQERYLQKCRDMRGEFCNIRNVREVRRGGGLFIKRNLDDDAFARRKINPAALIVRRTRTNQNDMIIVSLGIVAIMSPCASPNHTSTIKVGLFPAA